MNSFMSDFYQYWPEWWPRLAEAAKMTAKLSSAGFALALLVGAILVAMIRGGNPVLRFAANFFIQFVRTVPLLALLLALYFALPPLGITLPGFWAGVLGLGLHGAAYVAEILRGGLQSLHRGQREAALSVGLAPRQVFLHVVFPQALRVMLAPLVNTYVALLKDSSLCALIATDELMLVARAMSSEYFLPLHIFLLVGVFYFAIAFPLSMLSRVLEQRLSRGRRVMGAT
ncbi:amino acid ABC transporter permease [Rhodoferax sp. AJA081-3]|uniref:amino acid ABC transporter permease n=1 Tax=Rhodoferax sp. AJA081-3 TaxID=2752316 RepID=UPI001AE05EF4|nr:amino acid ABC transporter permease [Rhodoferax sp. AJA081-3]QTN26710.1 amino acid ABC transporter permease [Rhodoferax sp. AJA081-3]